MKEYTVTGDPDVLLTGDALTNAAETNVNSLNASSKADWLTPRPTDLVVVLIYMHSMGVDPPCLSTIVRITQRKLQIDNIQNIRLAL